MINFDFNKGLPDKYRYQGYNAIRHNRLKTRQQQSREDEKLLIEKIILDFANVVMRDLLQKQLDEIINEFNNK